MLTVMRSLPCTLARNEVRFLHAFKKERRSIRQLNRANTLLLLHRGKRETNIAEFLGTNFTTVWRTKRRYLDHGLEQALAEGKRSGQPRKYTTRHETELIAFACSSPPEGRKRWTLELLNERMRSKVKGCKTMNRETIRLLLKKHHKALVEEDVVHRKDHPGIPEPDVWPA